MTIWDVEQTFSDFDPVLAASVRAIDADCLAYPEIPKCCEICFVSTLKQLFRIGCPGHG